MIKRLNRFSFGITSSITTSLSLIVGLDTTAHPKASIISALAILALADNISDSLGIHIYRESENSGEPKIYTLTNFLSRFLLTCVFAAIVLLVPKPFAIPLSVVLGLLVLSVLSYFIAIEQKIRPYREIIKHLAIAVFAMIASHFAGEFITSHFG
jgi:vacuolar iron transporter family protein